MFADNWNVRHITDSAQCILKQVPTRASDRGLQVVDGSSLPALVLWSLVLWERKVGRVALETTGVDPFELARSLDELLTEKEREHEVAYDQPVALTLYERDNYTPPTAPDFSTQISRTFTESWQGLVVVGRNLVLIGVALSPWVVAAGIVVIPVGLIRRRRRSLQKG